jgi:hypothetical protein
LQLEQRGPLDGGGIILRPRACGNLHQGGRAIYRRGVRSARRREPSHRRRRSPSWARPGPARLHDSLWLARRGKPSDPTPLLQKELDCGDLEIPSVGRVLRIECTGDQYDRFRLLTAGGLYVTSDNRVVRLVPLEARAPAPVDTPPAPAPSGSPKPETAAEKRARRILKKIVADNRGIEKEDARKLARARGVLRDGFRYAARVDKRFQPGPKPQQPK